MTGTPTPGDLSARHVEVLREVVRAAKAAQSRLNGLMSGKLADLSHDEFIALQSALTHADAAIAALSALPAAGGAYPIQPLAFDEKGVLRFRVNTLVRHLLDNGGLTMNDLATVDCPTEEREQFAQLIGYSLGGFGTLSYVTDETYERAVATTPQPSAAEEGWGPSYKQPWQAQADAAVGAQGDGWLAVMDALDLVNAAANDARHRGEYDKANKLVKARITLYRAARANEESAAPAAGKGVDEVAFWRAYRRWYGAAKGYKDMDADAAHDFITREAALTRQPVAGDGYQDRVGVWMDACFPRALYGDMTQRCDRFLEESLELLQSMGYDRGRVATLVDYVWGRPVGEPKQEVGGTVVTLAALCWVAGIDMHGEAQRELERIERPEVMAKIRAKQEVKNALHFDSPLPGHVDG